MITRRSLDPFAVGCAVAMVLVCGGWLRADWARGQEAASPSPPAAADEPADAAPAERDESPPPATAVPRYSDPAESPSRQVRVYRLRYADPALLIDALESMAPEAQFTIDAQNRSVLVVGSEQSLEAVAEVLSELDVPPEDGHQIKVFRLVNIHADSAAELLAELLHADEVRIAIDERSNSLIVTGPEHTLNVAEAILLRLDEQAPLTKESQPPTLAVYQLRHATAGSLIQLLGSVTDDAKLTVSADDAGKRLIVFGSPQSHELVKDLLEKLDTPDAKQSETPQLVVYPLRHADAASVFQVLQTAAPDAQVSADPKTGSLVVFASKPTHEVVEKLLRQLDAPPEDAEEPQAPRFEAYDLSHSDSQAALSLLSSVAPEARAQIDPRRNRLLVWGPPQSHEKVKDFLSQLDAPSEESDVTRIFPLRQADPDSVSLVLSNLLSSDDARIATDQRTNALIVTCSQEKLAVVEEVLAQLDHQAEERERQYARPVTFQVRVVWLAGSLSGEETADPAEDLKDVVAELSKVGVSGLRQVGQAMVSTTPDGSFQVGSSPIFQEQEVDWKISGELRNVTEEGTYHLDMNIELTAASQTRPGPGQELVDMEVQIAASCGRYVVLGVTPIGSLTSAFVVQVTAGGP